MQVIQSPLDACGRVDGLRANLVGAVAVVVFVGGHVLLATVSGWGDDLRAFSLTTAVIWVALGVPLHEALHGLGFRVGGVPWSKIHFGVLWKYLMPYAACSEAMPVESYRLAVLLPGVVIGVFPWFLGGIMGNHELAVAGAVLTAAAAGDWLVWVRARGVPAGAWVQDLKTEVGFGIVGREEDERGE